MRRWWVRAAVSLAIIVVLLTFVPLGEVRAAIRGVSPWVWAACVIVFVAGQSLNALKLWVLVGPRAAPAASCLRAHFAGIAANLGLPGVAGGDVVRAAYLAPSAGTSRVVAAAVADRIVDLLVVLLFAAIALPLAGAPAMMGESLHQALRWSAGVLVAIAVLVALARRRLRGSTGGWGRLQAALSEIVERPAAVATAAAIAIGVQTAFVLTNAWLGSAVGLTMAMAPWFLAWIAARLAVIAPISLGGIGVREAALVSVLAALGAPPDRALAVGVLWDGAVIAGSVGGFVVTQAAWRAGHA